MATKIIGFFLEKFNINLKKQKKWKFLLDFINPKSGLGGEKPA
jgi:hypothetical protein